MQLYAIIVAGGIGKRMGTDIPKQFLELDGKPVLMHSISRFIEYNKNIEIITVLPEDQIVYWQELRKKYSFSVPHIVVKGGETRFFSVKNGLAFINSPGLVAVHDGVRPNVSIDTINRCFETARRLGNAIPVITPSDTIRMVTGDDSQLIDRQKIRLVQTPQVFDAELLIKAYNQNSRPDFTDDASVVESYGTKIHLVKGNRENIKITNPGDLQVSEALKSGAK
jgi:2-C-methyl-D-erythritol 4-phosphate cytidylyltransferase